MRYRKKPVEIEAWQWNGEGLGKMPPWVLSALDAQIRDGRKVCALTFNTLEGKIWARRGDFIIQGVKGEVYPCKPDIFAETYEPA